LTITSQHDKYGFRVRVKGGGKHAQAGAVKLALARALLVVDEGFRKQLKDTGMLTRDPRAKERKKFGLKRARRAPQFSKR
jgi:small subunit ribosomal protein S9